MYHYFDPPYFVPTLRIVWEVNWYPEPLSVQVQEYLVKNACVCSKTGSFEQWKKH